MQNFYVRDIVKATKGEVLCGDMNIPIENVSTDSNSIKENSLFVPI